MHLDQKIIIKQIEAGIQYAIDEAVAKEIEAAKVRVEEAVKKQLAGKALELLKEYQVSVDRNNLIITVRNV